VKKKGWIGLALLGIAVLVVWLLYINRSWSEDEVERAKVDVQQRVCFVLRADEQDVAYFHVLSSCGQYPIEDVNEMLRINGYEELGGK
jgi:hypothetical protein